MDENMDRNMEMDVDMHTNMATFNIDGTAGDHYARSAKRAKLSHARGQAPRPSPSLPSPPLPPPLPPPPPPTLGESRIFAPYRSVGLVSPTRVPFTSVARGSTTFQITTATRRSLQTYDLRRGLHLLFVTRPQTPAPITASIAAHDALLAAYGTPVVQRHKDAGPRDAQEERDKIEDNNGGDDDDNDDDDAPRQLAEGDVPLRGVWRFTRGRKEAELEWPPDCHENVQAFCIFGRWTVGVCSTRLLVWNSTSHELFTSLRGISPVPFTSCIASLPTFLNKIIVGRHDGSADIWNVSSGKLLYTILPPSAAYGPVTALQPTPALSLVAIAFENGPLLIHDVRVDQTLIQLSTPAGLPVTSISFRTDGQGAGDDGRRPGVMATASTATGDVTLWDLNNGGRKAGLLRAAHAHPTPTAPGGTSKIEFLAGQAILVSSGLDNSLKTWILDEIPFNPVPRSLHERRGHGAAVSKLIFLPTATDGSDDTGKWLLSGSIDRSLWGWSLRRDGQSTEISQGHVQNKAKKHGLLSGDRGGPEVLKCPPIVSIACSLNRDGGIGAIPGKHPIWQPAGKGKQVSAEISAMTGWESVLTAHENDKRARTWFWGRKRAGRWAFETGDGGDVTAVAMSPCGTFALLGSEKGGVDMFNMQSGIHRQRYPARLTPAQAKQLRLDVAKHGLIEEGVGNKKSYRGQGKHAAAVVGLAVDSLNSVVISTGADGRIKFWNFSSGLLQDQIDWSGTTGITSVRLHRGSDLAAFSCTDGCIRVIDTATRKLIRELWPSRTPIPELRLLNISDFTFSDDGRWITACLGQLVFTWDLPTGHLVDAFKLAAECTSLALSPTGEYLATATSDGVGIDIWTNRSLYTHVPTRHISQKGLLAIIQSGTPRAPAVSGEGRTDLLAAEHAPDEGADSTPAFPDEEVAQISEDLVSLSMVPRSRWQNLLYLDLIRRRNRPNEAPKKPEKAPFFLPSLQDRQPWRTNSADTTGGEVVETEKERIRVLRLSLDETRSEFTALLRNSTQTENYVQFLGHMKDLSPAAADVAIRSLSYESGELVTFVRAVTWQLQQKRDFDVVQAWMAVYLKVHGDAIVQDDAVRDAVRQFREALQTEKSIARRVEYIGGLIRYLRAARV